MRNRLILKLVILLILIRPVLLNAQTFSSIPSQEAPAPKDSTRQAGPTPVLDGLDDFIQNAMKEWKVPGIAVINQMTERLEHFHYDIFQVPDDPQEDYAQLKVLFFSDLSGDISSLAMPLEPHVKDSVFTRKPDQQLLERSLANTILQAAPRRLPFLCVDHNLIISRAGAEDIELIPSVVRSKPAICGHFKTGHRMWPGT